MSLTVRSRLPLAAAIAPAPPPRCASNSIEASSRVRPGVGPPAAHRRRQQPLTSPLTGNARHLSTTPRASSPARPTAGACTADQWSQDPRVVKSRTTPGSGRPTVHRLTRLPDQGAQASAALKAPALSATSGPQRSPRQTPAAQRPPGPPPRHLSRPSGH
ncbi:hypothetical protein NDU88_002882 [Pleurodeles waltl]|uniref:Uncharacterized protein n=1 Tax=Pleurodeles waltl TaxID=8319 RepID=A0AAV7M4N5_PLEWA|nr:hypothetical protein NDU88_002882 [Pleurodeles waltl]